MEKTQPFSSRIGGGFGVIGFEKPLLLSIKTGIFLVLFMPLIVSEGSYFPFIVGKALYSRSIIEIVFGLWLVLAFSHPSYRVPRSRILIALGVWFVVSVLAALTGVSIQRSLWSTYERMQGVVDLFHWCGFAIVVTSVFRSWIDWRVILNVVLVVGVLMALMGLDQHYEVGIFPFYDFLERTSRIGITFGNPSFVGAYMLVNVLIAMGLLCQSYVSVPEQKLSSVVARKRRRRRRARSDSSNQSHFWWRVFWLLATGLGVWMVLLSGTRGAFIGLSIGLITIAVSSALLRDWWRVLWVTSIALAIWGLTLSGVPIPFIVLLTTLVAIIVGEVSWGSLVSVRSVALKVIGVLVIGGVLAVTAVISVLILGRDTVVYERLSSSNIMARQITSTGIDDSSVTDRLASQSAGLEGFLARPILGWGPENYVIAWGRYFDADPDVTESFDQAHNKPIEELTTKGILGFLSYMAIWALMLLVLIRKIKCSDDSCRVLILFMAAALSSYFTQNLFLFDTPSTVLQFILLLSFVVNLESTLEVDPANDRGDQGVSGGFSSGDDNKMSEWTSRVSLPMFSAWEALGAIKMRLPRSDVLVLLGLAVILALVSTSIYYFNYRPYVASSILIKTGEPNISWEQRFGFFEESIDSFPPLANYPRLHLHGGLASSLIQNWDRLTPSEAKMGLEIMDKEAELALKSEPESWTMNVILAGLYQKAALMDSEYVAKARWHLNRATYLAPEVPDVFFLWTLQQILEKNYESPYGPVAEYLQLVPRATVTFITIWSQLDWSARTHQEISVILEMVERESREVIRGHPEEWSTVLALAHMYNRASVTDSDYVETSRLLVEEARRLAPETVEIPDLQIER